MQIEKKNLSLNDTRSNKNVTEIVLLLPSLFKPSVLGVERWEISHFKALE